MNAKMKKGLAVVLALVLAIIPMTSVVFAADPVQGTISKVQIAADGTVTITWKGSNNQTWTSEDDAVGTYLEHDCQNPSRLQWVYVNGSNSWTSTVKVTDELLATAQVWDPDAQVADADPVDGHVYERKTVVVTEPTCTETGVARVDDVCKTCGKTVNVVKDGVVKALGHSYGAASYEVVENIKLNANGLDPQLADPTKNGSYYEIKTCSRCKEVEKKLIEKKATFAAQDKIEYKDLVNVTVDEDGNAKLIDCKKAGSYTEVIYAVDGSEISSTPIVVPAQHYFTALAGINPVNATIEKDANGKAKTVKGHLSLTDNTVVADPTSNEKFVVATGKKCDVAGSFTQIVVCEICGQAAVEGDDGYVEPVEIAVAALAHTPMVTNVVDTATCWHPGVVATDYSCAVCGVELPEERTVVTVPRKEHEMVTVQEWMEYNDWDPENEETVNGITQLIAQNVLGDNYEVPREATARWDGLYYKVSTCKYWDGNEDHCTENSAIKIFKPAGKLCQWKYEVEWLSPNKMVDSVIDSDVEGQPASTVNAADGPGVKVKAIPTNKEYTSAQVAAHTYTDYPGWLVETDTLKSGADSCHFGEATFKLGLVKAIFDEDGEFDYITDLDDPNWGVIVDLDSTSPVYRYNNAGTYRGHVWGERVAKDGVITRYCKVCGESLVQFEEDPEDPQPEEPVVEKKNIAEAEIVKEGYDYTGEMQVVHPVVKYQGVELKEGIDFKVVGKNNFKNVGKHYLTIEGIGDYEGELKDYVFFKGPKINVKEASLTVSLADLEKESQQIYVQVTGVDEKKVKITANSKYLQNIKKASKANYWIITIPKGSQMKTTGNYRFDVYATSSKATVHKKFKVTVVE